MMRLYNARGVLLCVSVAAIAACWSASPARGDTVVRFQTYWGVGGEFEFFVRCYDGDAPITVDNFLNYVTSDRYNWTFMHRLAYSPYVIQGGAYSAGADENGYVSQWYQINTDPNIPNEFSTEHPNNKWTLAMAKLGGDPDSATSQFYINLQDNPFLDDYTNPSHEGYTVFANVIKGHGLVEQMGQLPIYEHASYFPELPVVPNQDPDGPLVHANLWWLADVSVYSVTGDADLDGQVDVTDLAILAANWRSQDANWATADWNEDGEVDVTDLAILAANWKHGQVSKGQPVPEPMTLAVVALGATGLAARRRLHKY
jgi:cyclophilin family peptidyl-prolyl cis-trans isomerase